MEVHQQQQKTVIRVPVNPGKQSPFPISGQTTTTTATNRSTFDPKSELKRCLFCSCVCLVLFILFSVGFCITTEQFMPPAFAVDSVIVYPFNISSSHITANWNITFCVRARNTQTYNLYLQDIDASVFYMDKNVSSTAMKPFNANSENKVEANVGVSSAYLESSIAKVMVADWSLGAVQFTIKVNGLVRRIDPQSYEEKRIEALECVM